MMALYFALCLIAFLAIHFTLDHFQKKREWTFQAGNTSSEAIYEWICKTYPDFEPFKIGEFIYGADGQIRIIVSYQTVMTNLKLIKNKPEAVLAQLYTPGHENAHFALISVMHIMSNYRVVQKLKKLKADAGK